MSTNRTALNVVLAVLNIEQREFAADMGYDPAYVANVFNNSTPPSDAFKSAFGAALADHLLGRSRTQNTRFRARPLLLASGLGGRHRLNFGPFSGHLRAEKGCKDLQRVLIETACDQEKRVSAEVAASHWILCQGEGRQFESSPAQRKTPCNQGVFWFRLGVSRAERCSEARGASCPSKGYWRGCFRWCSCS